MSQDLRELYQEVILDHGKRPRNHRRPDDATACAQGHNPLCGDRVTIYVRVADDGTIEDVAFDGNGCAISIASASLMTEALRGRSVEQARALFARFHARVTGEAEDAPDAALGKLEVLSGVRDFPVRVKCATLAWHALRSALESSAAGTETVVSTE